MSASEAGKGPDPRPVDPERWAEGWKRLQVQCPGCKQTVMRRRSGKYQCFHCGCVWEEKA